MKRRTLVRRGPLSTPAHHSPLGMSLHPFIVGQPFRLRAFRRAMDHIMRHRDELWITTPGEVAKYCMTLPEDVLPKPR